MSGAMHQKGARDGELMRARFDRPGKMTKAPSGEVLICDMRSELVRVVHDGQVRTLAPLKRPDVDAPRDIACDPHGTLFVSFANGAFGFSPYIDGEPSLATTAVY